MQGSLILCSIGEKLGADEVKGGKMARGEGYSLQQNIVT